MDDITITLDGEDREVLMRHLGGLATGLEIAGMRKRDEAQETDDDELRFEREADADAEEMMRDARILRGISDVLYDE